MKSARNNSGTALLKGLLVIALVGIGALIWHQMTTVGTLRQQAALAVEQQREIGRLREEIKGLEGLRVENQEVKVLRERLAVLESQNRELEKSRTELPRPKIPLATNLTELAELRDLDVYLPRESWTNVGFATPTATVETMFWSMREGNLQTLLESMTDDSAKNFTARFQNETDVELFWRLTRRSPVGRLAGYTVVDVENVSGTEAWVYLTTPQADAIGRDPDQMQLYLVNGEWKIRNNN